MILAALWWFGVATKVLGRDRGVSMGRAKAGRDIDLRSRPRLLKLGVTTWALGRNLGQDAWACRYQRTPSKRATYAGCARDMRTTVRPCVQQCPRPGHYARSVRATWFLGVRTVHTTQFCDNALFKVTVWTLFMSTVHRVKKIQNFLTFSCV